MTTSGQYADVRHCTTHLGFHVNTSATPAFADVFRGPLRLLLTDPVGDLIELFQPSRRVIAPVEDVPR